MTGSQQVVMMSLKQVASAGKQSGRAEAVEVVWPDKETEVSNVVEAAAMSEHNDDSMSIDWTLNMRRKCCRFFSPSKPSPTNKQLLSLSLSSSSSSNKCSSFSALTIAQDDEAFNNIDQVSPKEEEEEVGDGRENQFSSVVSGYNEALSSHRHSQVEGKLEAKTAPSIERSAAAAARQLISIDDLCATQEQLLHEMSSSEWWSPAGQVNQTVAQRQSKAEKLQNVTSKSRMIKINRELNEKQQVITAPKSRLEEIVLSMDQKRQQQQQQQQQSDNLSALSASSSLLSQLLNSSLNQLIEIDNGSSASPMPTSGVHRENATDAEATIMQQRAHLRRLSNEPPSLTSAASVQLYRRKRFSLNAADRAIEEKLTEYDNNNNTDCDVDERDLLVLGDRRTRLPGHLATSCGPVGQLRAADVKLTAGRRHLRRPPASARSCPVARRQRRSGARNHLPASNSVWSLQSSASSTSSSTSSRNNSTPSASSSVSPPSAATSSCLSDKPHLDRNQASTGCHLAGGADAATSTDANDLVRPTHFVTFESGRHESRDLNSAAARKHLDYDDERRQEIRAVGLSNDAGATQRALCGYFSSEQQLATPNNNLKAALPAQPERQQLECCNKNCPPQLINGPNNNNQHDSLLEEDEDEDEEEDETRFRSQCIYSSATTTATATTDTYLNANPNPNPKVCCSSDAANTNDPTGGRLEPSSSPDFQCCAFCVQLDGSQLMRSRSNTPPTTQHKAGAVMAQSVQQRCHGRPPLSTLNAQNHLDREDRRHHMRTAYDNNTSHSSQLKKPSISSSISTKSPTNSTSSSSSSTSSSSFTCGIQVTTTDCSSEDSCADRRQLVVAQQREQLEQQQQQQQQQGLICVTSIGEQPLTESGALQLLLEGRSNVMGLTGSRIRSEAGKPKLDSITKASKEEIGGGETGERADLLCRLGLCCACEAVRARGLATTHIANRQLDHQHLNQNDCCIFGHCSKKQLASQLEKSPISYLNELNNDHLVLPLTRLQCCDSSQERQLGEPIFGLDPRSIRQGNQPSRSSAESERHRQDLDPDQVSMVEATANLARVVLSRNSSRASRNSSGNSLSSSQGSSKSQRTHAQLTGDTERPLAQQPSRQQRRSAREEPIYDVPSMSLESNSPIEPPAKAAGLCETKYASIAGTSEDLVNTAAAAATAATKVKLRCLSPDQKYPQPMHRSDRPVHRIIDTIREEEDQQQLERNSSSSSSSATLNEMNLVNNRTRSPATHTNDPPQKPAKTKSKTDPEKQNIKPRSNRLQSTGCKCVECLRLRTKRSPQACRSTRLRHSQAKSAPRLSPGERQRPHLSVRYRLRDRRHTQEWVDEQLSLISRMAVRGDRSHQSETSGCSSSGSSSSNGSSCSCCCGSSQCSRYRCCSACCSRLAPTASTFSDRVVYSAPSWPKQTNLDRKNNLIKNSSARLGKGCCSSLTGENISDSLSSGCCCSSCCSARDSLISRSSGAELADNGATASNSAISSEPGSLTEEYLRRHLPLRRMNLSRRAHHLSERPRGIRVRRSGNRERSSGCSHSQNRHATSGRHGWPSVAQTSLAAAAAGNGRSTGAAGRTRRSRRRSGKYQIENRWPPIEADAQVEPASRVNRRRSLIRGKHATSGVQSRKMELVWDDNDDEDGGANSDQAPLVLKSTRRLRSISADSLERIQRTNGNQQQPPNVSSSSTSSSSTASTDDSGQVNSVKATQRRRQQPYKRLDLGAEEEKEEEEEEEDDDNEKVSEEAKEASRSAKLQLAVANERRFKREHLHLLAANNNLDLATTDDWQQLAAVKLKVFKENTPNGIDVIPKAKTESNNDCSQQVISTGDGRSTGTFSRLARGQRDELFLLSHKASPLGRRAGHLKQEADIHDSSPNRLLDKAPTAGARLAGERDRPVDGRMSKPRRQLARGLAQDKTVFANSSLLKKGANYHHHCRRRRRHKLSVAGDPLKRSASGGCYCARLSEQHRSRFHSHDIRSHIHSYHRRHSCRSSCQHNHDHHYKRRSRSQTNRRWRRGWRCKARCCTRNVTCRRHGRHHRGRTTTSVFWPGDKLLKPAGANEQRDNGSRLKYFHRLCLSREKQMKLIKLLDRRQQQQELERADFKQLELARQVRLAGVVADEKAAAAVLMSAARRREQATFNGDSNNITANHQQQLGRRSPLYQQLPANRMQLRLRRSKARQPTNRSHPPRRSYRLVAYSSNTSGCSFPTNLSGGQRNGHPNRSSVTMNQLRSMQKALIASSVSACASTKKIHRRQQLRQRTLRKVVSPVDHSKQVIRLQNNNNGDANFMDRFLVKTLTQPEAKLTPSDGIISSSNLFGWQLARRCQCSHCCLVEKLIWLDSEAKRERRRLTKK